jgi:hypothetical protein
MDEEAKIEEIRQRLDPDSGLDWEWYYSYEEDVSYLLKRVEQLEAENAQLMAFVDQANRELPNINSRFEEWLT